ncbi:MAG: SsrA-binding protein, partial [Candidatus Omnitrophica bacterium]|nr:SsrA-binding protein [Candidatus Omnitrophota bacterium]
MTQKGPVVSNRQAFRDFKIEKIFEAGLQLFGNEVKSLRAGEANLKGSFAKVDGEEIVLHNMHISPYEFSRDEQDPLRPRKLLLH